MESLCNVMKNYGVTLKVGRNILNINENDLILDNGSCYQIITKQIGSGFNKITPVISKKLFTDLKKCELIFTSERLRLAAIQKYGKHVKTYWKFNVERMKNMGY